MNRSALIAASAATAILFATAARAENRDVRTSDLDLASPVGQIQLDARIDRAARAVCRIEVTGSRIPAVDKTCRAKAATSAREALAARGLTTKSGG